VLAGAYADLLWNALGPEELAAAGVDDAWRAHRRAAVDDFGALVAHVAAGGALVLFPEGEPSPDGGLGPLRPGLASLVRRSGAGAVTPIALAIDPLAGRRPRAYVSLGEPLAPPPADLPGAVLAAWRRAMPLTVGQVAARALAEGGGAALAAVAVAEARAAGRPVEPELVGSQAQAAVERALAWARRRRGLADPAVRRLAAEQASARGA
jgi:hypothetical protein